MARADFYLPNRLAMSEKFLKAGIIGLGVGERHIASYQSDARCQVVALCDMNPKRLQEVGANNPDCRLTQNAEEILTDPEIDVVSIASYDTYHCEQVVTAVKAGKHVFVEKPLCLHDEEFECIDAALLQHPDVQLSSNLILRRAPQFQLVKERIESGEFGRLFYLEGDYNYGRIQKITEGWRGQIPFYSVSHGGAIHLIDLILWLSGGQVEKVLAVGNQIATETTQFQYPDLVTALLKFEDGMTAKVSANFGCVCPHHHALAVYGTQASFIHNFQGGAFYQSRDPKDPAEKVHLAYESSQKGGVQQAFVGQILDGTPAEVSKGDVMNAMAVSLAVERSLRSHDWESVRYANLTNTAVLRAEGTQ